MCFNYKIEQLQDESAISDALELVWQVFIEFEAPDYSDEGVAEFKKFIEPRSIIEMILDDKLFMWGCFDRNRIVGVIATRPPCHISLLFVNKRYHRQGIARSMYNTILDFYKTNSVYTEMTVNSSPYAIGAYHSLGFEDTNTEQTLNGIRFTPMKNRFR